MQTEFPQVSGGLNLIKLPDVELDFTKKIYEGVCLSKFSLNNWNQPFKAQFL